ncbi:MAG: DUF1353 domain-containing protein [Candidatus Bipolaricaulis sp.]|nr:DUF1353 domain-containing protein [Candidatus Bipolaricaulis sp.]
MSSFTSDLTVSVMKSGNAWKLARAFTYRIGSKYSKRFIRVVAGFITDFASIPKLIFLFLPWWAKYSKASVLHDWLYRARSIMGKPITRKEADNIFREAMLIEFRTHKSGKFVANLEYYAVRWFAWLAWKGNK